MVRTIFMLLVLLNLIALAWIYFNGDDRINAGREPQRAMTQLAADKVRIVAVTDVAADNLSPAQATPSSVSAAEICRAYAGAKIAEAQEIARSWADKLPSARIAINPVAPRPVFALTISGLASRSLAEAKMVELKKLGISDGIEIKADDDKHFSVWIATFTERDAAEEALKAASRKGVRSATVGQRQPVPEQAIVEVRGSEQSMKPLTELAAARKNLNSVACSAQ